MAKTKRAVAQYSDWLQYVLEQLEPVGRLRTHKMFGCVGVYANGVFFAIIAQDVLYLKADQQSRPIFEAEGMQPFRYTLKDGRCQQLSYYALPEQAYEDRQQCVVWAQQALAAAQRAQQRKTRPMFRKSAELLNTPEVR